MKRSIPGTLLLLAPACLAFSQTADAHRSSTLPTFVSARKCSFPSYGPARCAAAGMKSSKPPWST
jgi:hypothetical protein